MRALWFAAPALPLLLALPQDGGDGDEEPQDPSLGLGDIPIEELSGAEREEAELLLHVRLEEQYFLTCDQDGDGWVSFREAVATMKLERGPYFQFDLDRDGRITREEFGKRYRSAVENVGSFPPPTSPKSLFETVDGSPLAYDFNGSAALEEGELNYFLKERGIMAPANALFGLLDKDGSGALEVAEFADLVETLTPLVPADVLEVPPTGPSGRVADPIGPPTSIDDLFGMKEPREVKFGTTPLPDRIVGPVTHFRRLDFDDDGRLEESDLQELLRPARVDVRPGAVLAALDLDGDGALSPAELELALQGSNAPGDR